MAVGDHIKVFRAGYWHHGVDVGYGTCVHFTGEPGKKSNAEIKRTSITEFLDDGKLEVVNYARCKAPVDVVRTALSHVGSKGYNLISNNCEHFARYCKTGEKKSEQVSDAANTVGGLTGTGAGTYVGIAGVSTAGSVAGLSGAGVMSGLAAIGPGGVIGGLATLGAVPTVATNIAMSKVLVDDECLNKEERDARAAGRIATKVGSVAGAAGTVGAISVSGSVAGLSGAGITSGLAAIGGGSMLAGTAVAIAAPAAAAAVAGYGVYKLWKWLSD